MLGADTTAGSNVSLNLGNNNGLADDDYIIGHEGSELAELAQVNAAVSGSTSAQIATLKFNHKAGEPWLPPVTLACEPSSPDTRLVH